jgi:hypothetical protein
VQLQHVFARIPGDFRVLGAVDPGVAEEAAEEIGGHGEKAGLGGKAF